MAKKPEAKKEEKELAPVVDKQLVAAGYGEYEGGGFENTDRSDLTIPFLLVLQGLSPQVKDVDEGGVEGAKPGMLCNSVTNTLFPGKTGAKIVFATTQHVYCEYVPRKLGGGFRGVHPLDSQYVADAKKAFGKAFGAIPVTNGEVVTELIETFYAYGILLDEEENILGPIVVSFSMTKIREYKAAISKLRMYQLEVDTPAGKKRVNPPLFAHCCRIKTNAEKNAKGDFYNFEIVPARENEKGVPTIDASLLPITHPAFLAAADLGKSVNAGEVKPVDPPERQPGDEPTGEGGTGPGF